MSDSEAAPVISIPPPIPSAATVITIHTTPELTLPPGAHLAKLKDPALDVRELNLPDPKYLIKPSQPLIIDPPSFSRWRVKIRCFQFLFATASWISISLYGDALHTVPHTISPLVNTKQASWGSNEAFYLFTALTSTLGSLFFILWFTSPQFRTVYSFKTVDANAKKFVTLAYDFVWFVLWLASAAAVADDARAVNADVPRKTRCTSQICTSLISASIFGFVTWGTSIITLGLALREVGPYFETPAKDPPRPPPELSRRHSVRSHFSHHSHYSHHSQDPAGYLPSWDDDEHSDEESDEVVIICPADQAAASNGDCVDRKESEQQSEGGIEKGKQRVVQVASTS
ncbi:hypothetical protein HK102_011930 [Quaeritorhiza haematococci]|nr:hypothetical protein HK102_011930 [Quaeritorhiza haematococci]